MQPNRRQTMSTNNHAARSKQQSKIRRADFLTQISKSEDVGLTETELKRVSGGRKDPYKNLTA
jgi:hypothetical protein